MTEGRDVASRLEHARPIADVELVVTNERQLALEPLLIPARVALRPKNTARWLLSTPWTDSPVRAKKVQTSLPIRPDEPVTRTPVLCHVSCGDLVRRELMSSRNNSTHKQPPTPPAGRRAQPRRPTTRNWRPKTRQASGRRDRRAGTRSDTAARGHRVGQEPPDADVDVEAAGHQRFFERGLRERDVVIPEIPVPAGEVLDVRAERDQASAWPQAASNLVERAAERGLVRQVLEEIAGEDHVERLVGQRPALGAILLEKPHVGAQEARRVGVQVHREFLAASDRVDELAIAAA